MENKEKIGCPLQLAILLFIVSLSSAGATLFVGVDAMLTVSIVSLIAAIAAGIALQIHESNQHEDEPERPDVQDQGRAQDKDSKSEGEMVKFGLDLDLSRYF